MVKLIANERIHKTEAGGELEVADNVANVLVLLGKAKYAEGHEPAPVTPVRTTRPSRQPRTQGQVGAVTRQSLRQGEDNK